jgi:hypothetical protein
MTGTDKDKLRHVRWTRQSKANAFPFGSLVRRDSRATGEGQISMELSNVIKACSKCSERELIELYMCHFFFLRPVVSTSIGVISPQENHRGGNKR